MKMKEIGWGHVSLVPPWTRYYPEKFDKIQGWSSVMLEVSEPEQ